MHVVKIGNRYLGLVDAQTQALRVPDAEDGRVMVGALLSATIKNGDNLPEGRPVLLTTRAMRADRAAAADLLRQKAEEDQNEPAVDVAADVAAVLMDVRDAVIRAFNVAIDRLASR